MLVIRLQRTGRSGHAQFRVVVQDSRFSPTSGRVVDYVGSYDPHSKVTTVDKEKIEKYLSNGAQPSPRVASLLKKEGVKLPDWVKLPVPVKKEIKHPEKLRRNRPVGEPAPEAKPESDEVSAEETPVEEAPAQEPAEVEAAGAEEKTEPEAPAEDVAVEEEAKPAEEEKEEPAEEKVDAKS